MARDFKKMTKEELSLIITDSDFAELNTAELNQLRSAAKQAGILSVQFDNILSLAINNQTYEDIKNSKDYTAEEKAIAFDARNEYNRELRSAMKNKYYNAEEILSRAVIQDGKYFFSSELTKGEMDFLVKSGALRISDFGNGKDYKVGQEKESNLDSIKKAIAQDAEKRDLLARLLPSLAENAAKREAAAAKKTAVKKEVSAVASMPAGLQKSYDFWNKFNEKTAQSGVKFNFENLSNQSLLVEAVKNSTTMFKGIDHGTKGFDIVKRDKSAEPYEIFDLLVKKAKAANPKTKIRIKDNVKDEVMRNKILIACAKNNMTPVGNLPEGFDFEELKALVKDAKTTEEINDLAYNLYQPDEFEVDAGNSDENTNAEIKVDDVRMFGIQPQTGTVVGEDKDNKASAYVGIVNTNGANNPPVSPSNNNNGRNNNQSPKQPVVPQKRPLWKKLRDAAVIAGIGLLSLIGIRSCQNQERLEKNVKDLKEQVDKKKITDCEAVQALAANEFDKGYLAGKKDCEDSKKPKPPVRKTTPKKKAPVKSNPVVIPGDTIRQPDVIIPGDTIRQPDVIIPGKKIQLPDEILPSKKVEPITPPAKKIKTSGIPLEEVDTSIKHEKDYDLNEALELDARGKVTTEKSGKGADNSESENGKGKTYNASDPEVFNALWQLTQNQNIH